MQPLPLNYCLLDAARMLNRMERAKELNPQYDSLYRGRKEEALSIVAPHLFAYEEGTEFAGWLAEEGWGDSWGVFMYAIVPLEEVCKHFQRFLLVKTEDNQELYFRFYDPRVLRVFLPTCSTEQLQQLFGPVRYFLVEDEDPTYGLLFFLRNGQLQTHRVEVKPVAHTTPEQASVA